MNRRRRCALIGQATILIKQNNVGRLFWMQKIVKVWGTRERGGRERDGRVREGEIRERERETRERKRRDERAREKVKSKIERSDSPADRQRRRGRGGRPWGGLQFYTRIKIEIFHKSVRDDMREDLSVENSSKVTRKWAEKLTQTKFWEITTAVIAKSNVVRIGALGEETESQ